jgi:hypothetical protein
MAETPRERQLREVLEHVLRFGRLEHRTDSSPYETCYDWCPRCIINRALRATPEPAPTEKTWKCLYCETVNPKHFKCCLVCHLAREKQDAAPTEHPELQLDPEVTEMLTEAIKRGAPEPQDTLESLPDSPSHWVKDRFLKAHPDTVRLETAQRCVEIADRVAFMGNPIRERAALDIIEAIKQEFGLDAAVAAEREEKP